MIAIISDIHDNLVNLNKVLKYCKEKNITILICCGDICNSDTLQHLANNFKNKIYLSAGNIELFDEDEPTEYENIEYFYREGGIFTYQNKIIGVCHELYRVDILIKKYYNNKKVNNNKANNNNRNNKVNNNRNNKLIDIIFYGHTHQPWEQKKDNSRIVNPGNIANIRHQPTFATYAPKTNELKLHLLDNM